MCSQDKNLVNMELFYVLVLVIVIWPDVFMKTHSAWKRVSFTKYVIYTSMDLTIKQTKQEHPNEGRNWDKFNKALDVAFIPGTCTEWESKSSEDVEIQRAQPRATQNQWQEIVSLVKKAETSINYNPVIRMT